jgi:hypothetical protein
MDSFLTENNEKLAWAPARASAPSCGKCGHIGQLWQWWWIAFCRACLCFSVQDYHRSQ